MFKNFFETINNKYNAVQDAAENMMNLEAQMAAEKYQREVDAVNNIRQLADDSRIACESAARSDRKATIAIWVAIVSIIIALVANVTSCIIAHRDSCKSSEDIINAIQDLKGVMK